MTETYPNRLREIRKSRKLTQQQLADLIDTSNQQIGLLESGKRRMSSPWIDRLSQALDISPGELFTVSELDVAHVSWVQAGTFADTTDPYVPENTPTVAIAGLKHGLHIALTVDGDSMNLVAPDKSIIAVDLLDRDLRPGKDYVFRMNDQATFKRWRDDPPRLEPYSSNPSHEIIFPKGEIEVVGRVVKVIVEL